jgi:hypothetical protein
MSGGREELERRGKYMVREQNRRKREERREWMGGEELLWK